MKITWLLKKLTELLPGELYDIMQLRQRVFVVEQNCHYMDADGKDVKSYHLSARNEKNELTAYARIIFPGVSYPEVSIGRVITAPEYRRTGLGLLLMEESLKQIEHIYGKTPVRIGAQFYLIDFYKKFRFETEGEIYFEEGIKHIIMVRKA